MNMATKNDNAKVIEPEIKVINGKKTIIDKAYDHLSNEQFIKIMGVVK